MIRNHYVGLDIASVTGIAKWVPEMSVALVDEVKGTPIHQLQYIIQAVLPPRKEKVDTIFVLETPHHFQNANTTRSLLERYGYIKHSLLGFGYKVREPNLNTARSWLGAKNKQEVFNRFISHLSQGNMLTSNHTDALLMALYQAEKDGAAIEWSLLEISQGVFV